MSLWKFESTSIIFFLMLFFMTGIRAADPETIFLWNGTAPGETTLLSGERLATRPNEHPPATRISNITQPSLQVFQPDHDKRNGAAVIICPGGGYRYVVSDKEGQEPAKWLNSMGITAFVLGYRTKREEDNLPWKRPLEDAQRAMRLVRSKAEEWKLHSHKIGIMGFSAGGQVAALTSTRWETSSKPFDTIDSCSSRPDFSMLIYPAYLWDLKTEALTVDTPVTDKTPTTFLVHTHDDGLSSLGPVAYYSALKKSRVPAELHVYQSGGHGYGMREVPGTSIHTWIEPAGRWLSDTLDHLKK